MNSTKEHPNYLVCATPMPGQTLLLNGEAFKLENGPPRPYWIMSIE